jgi:hypothetical protein
MNKQAYISQVAKLLLIEGRPPHHVMRRIESCYLLQMGVADAVAAVKSAGEMEVKS